MGKLYMKGITLIALVITIIVLLILSGVTINILTGENGIITNAIKAKNNTIIAEENEKINLVLISAIDMNGNFDKELLKKELKNQGLTYEEDPEGNITIIGTNEKYVINKKGEKGTINTKVNIGDYVAYDATNNYSYTSPKGNGTSHGNGEEDQKFTSNSNIKWRVLSNDLSTGEILLISANPLRGDNGLGLKVKGIVGFLYAEQEINEICSIYGHGKGADTSKRFNYKIGYIEDELKTGTIMGSGARSININDINSVTGYNPEEYDGYGNTGISNIRYVTTKTEDGKSTEAKSITIVNSKFRYLAKDYISDSESSLRDLIFGKEEEFYTYHTASRASLRMSESSVGGYILKVRQGGLGPIDITDNRVINMASNEVWEGGYTSDIRPIVYLKINCKLTEKDSNGAWIIQE